MENNTTPRMLCLCAGDPDGDRPFSGSARALFNALEKEGCLHHKGNVLGWSDSFEVGSFSRQMLRRLDRFGVVDAYQWSALSWARNTARAEALAGMHPGFDAVLMYGTTYHPRLNVPTYVYLDATSAQVAAAKVWEFARFSPRKVNQIVSYQQKIFDDCTAVFPRSEWVAESLRNDYHLPENKIVQAGAGPNLRLDPLPHASYAAARILFIGVEWERKGGPLIVEAFRKVRARIPHATLAIVGCSPPVDEPGVEVIGHLSRKDPVMLHRLMEEYSRASLFCIMSDYEPFGIVIVEAQACEVPCVAPRRFAFPETILDGQTGALVDAYDPELLARTFTELLGNPERLAAMGVAARQHVAERWTWEVAARRIRDRVNADLARLAPVQA